MGQPHVRDESLERAFAQAMDEGHTAAWNLDWEAAADAYQRAVQLKPNDYFALTNLGLALFSLERYQDAARMYRKAAEVAPQEPLPWEKLSQIYEALDQPKSAVEAAMHAAERYARNRQWDRAIANWERAVVLAPSYVKAHYYLAMAYEKSGRKYDAVNEYLYAASLLQRVGRTVEANRLVQRALQLAPQSPEARQALQLLSRGHPIPLPPLPAHLRAAKAEAATLTPSDEGGALTQDDEEPQGQTPIEEAFQQALSVLAELLFMQAEDEDEATSRAASLRDRLHLLEQAKEAYQRLERRERDTIILLLTQVLELQSRGQWAQAAAELERAIKAGLYHAALFYVLGVFYYRAKDYRRAYQALQRALSSPDFGLAARLLRAKILYDAGKLSAAALEALEALALADWQTAPESQREAVQAYYESLREDLKRRKDPAAWKHIVTAVLKLLDRPDWKQRIHEIRNSQAGAAGDDGDLDAWAPLAEFVIGVDSSELVEQVHRIRQFMRQGHYDAAMEEAHFALFDAPTFLPLHSLIGDILWLQGLLAQASEKFLVLGRTYYVRGEGYKAVQAFKRVLEINPLHAEAHRALIQLLLEQGAYHEAIEAYRRLGDVHYQLANLDEAQEAFEAALKLAQQYTMPNEVVQELLLQLANIAHQKLDWRKAREYYRRLLETNPHNADAWQHLLDLDLRSGRDEQAFETLDRMFRTLRSTPGGTEMAIRVLEALVNEYPQHVDLKMQLAKMYAFAGETQKALETYQEVIEGYQDQGNTAALKRALQAVLSLPLPPNKLQPYRELLRRLRNA